MKYVVSEVSEMKINFGSMCSSVSTLFSLQVNRTSAAAVQKRKAFVFSYLRINQTSLWYRYLIRPWSRFAIEPTIILCHIQSFASKSIFESDDLPAWKQSSFDFMNIDSLKWLQFGVCCQEWLQFSSCRNFPQAQG